MSHLIYEDILGLLSTWSIHWWKSIAYYVLKMLPVLLVFLVFVAFPIQPTQQGVASLIILMLAITTLFILFFLVAFPIKYQIFNDRIRVAFSLGLHFDIPFNNIENVSVAKWKDLLRLNLNFTAFHSSGDILQITRKRGAKVHITPWDRKLFLEYLNEALDDWRRSAAKVGG